MKLFGTQQENDNYYNYLVVFYDERFNEYVIEGQYHTKKEAERKSFNQLAKGRMICTRRQFLKLKYDNYLENKGLK